MLRVGRRRLILAGALGLLLICAGAGGAAWSVLSCDRFDYLDRAKTSYLNLREQYLFACGRVWHSVDAGTSWVRVPARGLPLFARDGHIAVDRTPGRLYLGLLVGSRSSLTCLLCTWTEVHPAIYVSSDGGGHWALAHQFHRGPAGATTFRALHADPNYAEAAWAIIKIGDETAYYGTNTGGESWRKTCVEEYSGLCDPPDELLEFRHLNRQIDEGEIDP